MTAVLGISAFYHDSAAALVVDGEIVAAAQEERFTRNKHDHRFPARAIEYCLAHAGLTPDRLDLVGFYEKPLRKFDRLLETYMAYAPVGFRSFMRAAPLWLRQKLHIPRELRRGLPGYRRRFVFAGHHESHAASAFFPSPYDEAAILTLDGVGEWSTATLGVGRGSRIELTHELRFPHSLGLLYTAFTYYCGFKVNSGEYKLMGLAPYGEPIYADRIREHLVDIKDDGSFRMDMRYFSYCQGLAMTNDRFARLFGAPRRDPESALTRHYMDVAASIQRVTEDIMLAMARFAHAQTGLNNLCLAGGVALNCVANGRISREGPFDGIWIQPAAGDAGGALGVALLIWHQLLDNPREPRATDAQRATLLGPAYADDDIRAFLDRVGARYRAAPDRDALCDQVADALAADKVVGWFQGRMEFGPRALGSRSILGDARSAEMQSVMNRKIKFRESFRPFAPSVLGRRAHEYFDLEPGVESPYMLLVAAVRDDQLAARRGSAQDDGDGDGDVRQADSGAGDIRGADGGAGDRAGDSAGVLARLEQIRSVIPAVTHVDGSARVQTVDRERHGVYCDLLEAFERKTGTPVVINTSFNVRGEPIVCTPEDAYRCFMSTNMDMLVLGGFLLDKDHQPGATRFDTDAHLARFELD